MPERFCATFTVAVVPTAVVGSSVMLTPGTMSVKVLVEEVAVMPEAEVDLGVGDRLRTAAPPSRSVPSPLVRVKAEAAPVLVDSAISR